MHSLLGLNSWSSRCSLALLSIQWLVREVSLYWSNSWSCKHNIAKYLEWSSMFTVKNTSLCLKHWSLIVTCDLTVEDENGYQASVGEEYLYLRWSWEEILKIEDDTEDDINSCVKDDTCDKASSRVQWRNCNVVTGSWAYPPPKKKCLQIIFSDILITCLKMFKCFSLSLILCSSLRD